MCKVSESDETLSEILANNFKAAFEAVSGHAYLVRTQAEVCDLILKIAQEAGAKRVALAELPDSVMDEAESKCTAKGMEVLRPPYQTDTALGEIDQVQVGVTGARFGIAETGTLAEVVFDDTSRLVSALPRTHIGIVHARDLVETLRGSAARMTELYAENPENIMVSYISGPSRTGDIEMILTLGVHGPEHAHAILILGDDA